MTSWSWRARAAKGEAEGYVRRTFASGTRAAQGASVRAQVALYVAELLGACPTPLSD